MVSLRWSQCNHVARRSLTLSVVSRFLELCPQRKTIAFCASVNQALNLAEQFNSKGIKSEAIVANTTLAERDRIFAEFTAGTVQIITSMGVLCLDAETEILTDKGWTGIDDMTYSHKIANWDNGRIFFAEPKNIAIRDRHLGERMVIFSSEKVDLRVTEDHVMVTKFFNSNTVNRRSAKELVGMESRIPVSGKAEVFDIRIDQELPVSEEQFSRQVSANSYILRKQHGYGFEESKLEASQRLKLRQSVARKQPSDLTQDECIFIGFYLGDGSKTALNNGGVNYCLIQSEAYPKIIEFVDALIERCGLDVRRRRMPPAKKSSNYSIRWDNGWGTGFGCNRSSGVYHLELYLIKEPNNLLWGFTEEQFDAFIYGWWLADGDHGQGDIGNKKLLSLITRTMNYYH